MIRNLLNQKGTAPVLLLVGIVSVMGILMLLNFAPVKNQFLSSFFPKSDSQAAESTKDVTAFVEQLGNPAKQRWVDTNNPCRYARNVWDLQSFSGKLFIGSGNSSNLDPCINAGPVNIMSYNPTTNQFINELSLNEEQVDQYKILNGQLVIPGHDPKDDWTYGNWYRLENGSWVKHRNIKDQVHNFDMGFFQGKLITTGTSQNMTTSQVQFSNDDGATWIPTNLLDPFTSWTLLPVGNKVFITRTWQAMFQNITAVYEFNGTSTLAPLTAFNNANALLPQTPLPSSYAIKIIRPIVFNNITVYIGVNAVNDQQSDPISLYKVTNLTSSGSDASRITLPGNAKPWDMTISNGKLFALGSIQNGSRYWITVSSTTNLNTWVEEFRFDSPSFARSFEELNGDWYFGLGTDATTLSINSGDIIRVKASSLVSPSASVSSPPISGPVSPSPVISPSPTKMGDIDGNGKVDIFDYNQLLTDFGKRNDSNTKADLDNDDDVDIFDYNLLLSNYGK